MPLVQTRGAASAQGFGEFAQVTAANYIEEVFSTYLYTGNGSTQTITNGIDTSTYGGLVWLKDRSSGQSHALSDTARGVGTSKQLQSNTTGAATTDTFTGFTTSGFTLDASFGAGAQNLSAVTYASWTFREQPKFFDVVTYTGNGANRTIAHNLGSVPGCIIVKRTDTAAAWAVYHRSLANTEYLVLNSTAAKATGATWWNSTTPTSTVFSVGTDASVNASGATYVAYLFAHDAGGFGLTGTDNVISCGSFTSAGPSTDVTVTLGYEPQWIMVKDANVSADWEMFDVMRGMSNTNTAFLKANKSDAETNTTVAYYPRPTATGFIAKNSLGADSGNNIIYIAIRRGPMKVPTLGTSVLNITTSVGTNPAYVSSFPVDFAYRRQITGTSDNYFHTRLQGAKTLYPNYNVAEDDDANVTWDYQNGMFTSTGANANQYGWLMRRAPSFMDIVCYTGTGSGGNAQTHNLGAVPELIITKIRSGGTESGVGGWGVYTAALGATNVLELNLTVASAPDNWFYVTPTATTFYVSGNDPHSNRANGNYVAYLFATCAGVSKVGSYTGNGTTQTINCGFTGGARFVLIKRTDSTGDWYVWDSARGIVAGNDPYLLLNSTAAEVTSTDYVDTYSAGFEISSTAPAAINANGGSFIFLAIA